jgi:hypothetical protein
MKCQPVTIIDHVGAFYLLVSMRVARQESTRLSSAEANTRNPPGNARRANASAAENGQRTALSNLNNAICNGHPRDAHGTDLARRYYQRELRSLSFPGSSLCCRRSCCIHRSVLWRWIAFTDRSSAGSTMMRQAACHLNRRGLLVIGLGCS